MGCECGTYGWGEGVYRVLVGKLEGRRPLGRPRRRWVDNIRMDLQEVGCGYMDSIGLALSVSCAEVTIGHITMQPQNIIQKLYALILVNVCLEAIPSTSQIEAVVSSKALVSNSRRVLPGIVLNLERNKRHSCRDIYILPKPDWNLQIVRKKHVLYSQSAIKFHHVVTGPIPWRHSVPWLFWHLIWRKTNKRNEQEYNTDAKLLLLLLLFNL